MTRWWRAYDEAVDDPKLQRLSPPLFKAWFNILCLASRHGGTVPDVSHIAFGLRIPEQKASAIITGLTAAGLLDKREDGKWEPHNWNRRQYAADPTAAERMRNYRNRKRNGNRNSNSNEVVTPVTTRADTEQNREEKNAAPPPSHEKQLFDRGRELFGEKDGGSITKRLLKTKNNDIAAARAAMETAAQKSNPRQYIHGVINAKPREGEFVWKSGIPGVL